jgi:thymidylate synthase (FAD)
MDEQPRFALRNHKMDQLVDHKPSSVGAIIKVLDHGFVRLVDSLGNDLSVVRAARVSFDAAWRAGADAGSDARLISYLWKHQHTSPFEAVVFRFEVKAPIFVLRQGHRHRTWSYNELSARYRELPEEFYVPDPTEIGIQATSNRQGRALFVGDGIVAKRQGEVGLVCKQCERAFAVYRELLASNWPRELARSVMPVATYSHMFATVNLLNLMKFWTLRSDPHAQHEIKVYSDAMRELVRPIVPVCIEAWEEA